MRSRYVLAVAGVAVAALTGLATPASAATTPATTTLGPAATVIGIEFVDANFQGATYTVTGGTCTATTSDVDFYINSMPGGWNDVISSFRSYANCYTKLYEDNNRTGATYGFVGDSSYVGNAMNDRASSIEWS
ncbi:hypothetical protein [Streptomyces sp. WM6378]|uniref:hypothetical protein n=1 Tax=Streptomyces sp. WM6378 TaxID=1415557 RepID=UPI000ACD7F5D|nr:hypothetical protein [Streptomyces sp. WM6378]